MTLPRKFREIGIREMLEVKAAQAGSLRLRREKRLYNAPPGRDEVSPKLGVSAGRTVNR